MYYTVRGYGINIDEIDSVTKNGFEALLSLAPVELQRNVTEALQGVENPDVDDYLGLAPEDLDECEDGSAIAILLKSVIQKEAHLVLETYVDSLDGKEYLLLTPSEAYPWEQAEQELTEADLDEVFDNYVGILTEYQDEPFADYVEVKELD